VPRNTEHDRAEGNSTVASCRLTPGLRAAWQGTPFLCARKLYGFLATCLPTTRVQGVAAATHVATRVTTRAYTSSEYPCKSSTLATASPATPTLTQSWLTSSVARALSACA